MTLIEYVNWLDAACLNDAGTMYLRPEFLWYNEYRRYYEDLVMEQPKFERTLDIGGILREYWCINFMLSPYPNQNELSRLKAIMDIAVQEQSKVYIKPYPNNTEKNLIDLPVEFWLREGPNSFSKVKISVHNERFPYPPNYKQFRIEYDK